MILKRDNWHSFDVRLIVFESSTSDDYTNFVNALVSLKTSGWNFVRWNQERRTPKLKMLFYIISTDKRNTLEHWEHELDENASFER